MASHFEQWEKDPFFPAAEEVQESADRMESTYRTLLHALKDPSLWNIEELKRDLHTALGTTKWQLEEFEKAVENSYSKLSCNNTKFRHREFVTAMENQVSKVSKCLDDSGFANGKPPRPWGRLNEGESNELALFLSGSVCVNDDLSRSDSSKNVGPDSKLSKHRRTASAGADIGSWNVTVCEDVSVDGLNEKSEQQPPRKVPSFSGFLNNMESKLQWSKNGYRKLKVIDHGKLHEIQPLSRGINACYERSKSCLETGDDCYEKQLYGWYGALKRQIQRSEYYVRHSRPTHMIFWLLVLIFLFVVTVHVM
ncbi:uncharacterized protein [Rutidosis leptorrhynchoides]|uniref:uncharacterized protein isoform X2 n=1 Tax=Rutidosis leptorrhynchoides TaxID=125765 RepID=UPI003A9A0C77